MTSTLPVLQRSRRRGTQPPPFSGAKTPFLSDSLTQSTTAILLNGHEPDVGHADTGPTWVQHPNSVSSLNLQKLATGNGEVYNNSGSGRSMFRADISPGSVAYTVRVELVIRGNTSGNNAGAVARLDATRDSWYAVELVPIGTPATKVQISLGRQLNGTFKRLQLVDWWPTPLTAGQVVILWLKVSNERKVVYAQGPGETRPRPICSDGNNEVTDAGFAGITLLRGRNTDGQHPQDVQAWVDRKQDPGPSAAQPTPDPIQVPAVLWVPPYGTAADTLQPNIWFREQEPFIRGVQQVGRLQVITSGIPGSGTYKPSPGALEAISFPYSDPPTGAKTDFDVTATAAQDTTTGVLTLSAADVSKLVVHDALVSNVTHEKLYVQGFPSSTTVSVLRNTGGSPVAPISVGDTFDVPGGDVSHSGSETDPYFARRIEVYDRFAENPDGSSNGGAAPTAWPDPVGSVRWYSWSMYFDPVFYPTANPVVPNESGVGTTKAWGPIHTQWKGAKGGSPPLAISHDNGELFLGGTKLEGSGHSNGYSLGAAPKGVWNWYVVGVRWETSSLNGWVEAYVNGVQKVQRVYTATMDLIGGAADPIYLKEGMYVSSLWDRYTGDLVNMPNGAIFKAWYSPVRVCSTKELAMSFYPGS